MQDWDARREALCVCARSYLDTPFPQHTLLSESAFESYLRDRGIVLPLRYLRFTGILQPLLVTGPLGKGAGRSRVCMLQAGGTPRDRVYVDQGVPIGRLRMARDQRMVGTARYHPFQVLLAASLHRRLTFFRMAAAVPLYDVQSNTRLFERHVSETRRSTLEFVRSDQYTELIRLVGMLIRIDPLAWPTVRGTVTYAPGQSMQDWASWRSSQDFQQIATDFRFTQADIQRLHELVSHLAAFDDPLFAWFSILRNANFDKLERLRGSAGRAQSLYAIAEILRRFAESWLGAQLPEEDDTRHGPQGPEVKRRLYGYPRVADRRRDVLRGVVREFGLDAQSGVTLFVEGDTELGFFSELAERFGLDLTDRGVLLVNLGGHAGIQGRWFRNRLVELRREECFPMLMLDEHPDARRRVERLEKQGLLPVDPVIWTSDFEEDNFTIGELVSVANRLARSAGAQQIRVKDVDPSASPTVIDAISRAFHAFRIDKNENWGRQLARWAVARRCPKAVADEEGERRAIAVLLTAFRSADASYRATVERRLEARSEEA